MAIALLAKLRSLHMAAIQYPYIVMTLPRIIAISSHTYVSRTKRLEPALTYLSTATLSTHFLTNNESVSIVHSPALSSSLRRLGTSDMSLKKVQVANRFGFAWKNTATAW